MTTKTILVLGALLTATAAGCAGNAGSPGVATAAGGAPHASASAQWDDDPIKYSRCMRENGMTWFPDPEDGRLAVRVPSDADPAKLEAAEEACRRYSPHGGDRPNLDPEALEQVRRMSQCMRENGVPNFPDPQPDGGIEINGAELGTGPGDPTFDAAEQACSKHRPPRAGGGA